MNVIIDKAFCRKCSTIISDQGTIEFDLSKLEDKMVINEIRSHLGLKSLDYDEILSGGTLVPIEDVPYLRPTKRKSVKVLDKYVECAEVDFDAICDEIVNRIAAKNKIIKQSRYVVKVNAAKPKIKVVDNQVHVICPNCGNSLLIIEGLL